MIHIWGHMILIIPKACPITLIRVAYVAHIYQQPHSYCLHHYIYFFIKVSIEMKICSYLYNWKYAFEKQRIYFTLRLFIPLKIWSFFIFILLNLSLFPNYLYKWTFWVIYTSKHILFLSYLCHWRYWAIYIIELIFILE